MNTAAELTPDSRIRATFDRVKALAPAVADTTPRQRIEMIRRLIEALLKRREEIYVACKSERGITPADIDGELLMVKSEAEFVCANLEGWMQPHTVEATIMTVGKNCQIQHEPKGTVLVLPSWNAPYAIGFVPTIGAIAGGNSVILKPSELSPASSAICAQILREAFPNGEVLAIEGGAEVAQALLACPFNHIFYIGNNQVGRLVMKAAADYFASVTLEMGGKNPSIIDASADIEAAAMKTAWGRLVNAGQACIAPDYVLVHESVAEQFGAALIREIGRMYNPGGTGFENNPEYPRIINLRHFERLKNLIKDAESKGATFLLGGAYRAEDRYIAPCVVTNVTEDMKLMKEEIFGPIIAIIPFKRPEEAVANIAHRDKPLAMYVFSRDSRATEYFLKHTTAGSSVVNHNLVQSGLNQHLPFGGVNSSGIGRMVGWYTFNECTNARSIVVDGPALGDPREMFPPLTTKYKQQLRQMLERKSPIPAAVVRVLHSALRLRGALSRR